MLDLVQVEQAIADRLREPLKEMGWQVELFPDSPEEFGRAVGRPRIFVGFRQEAPEAPKGISGLRIIQPADLEFELIFQIKNLRTHIGALAAIQVVRNLLTGFQPVEEVKPKFLYETKAGFLNAVQGLWLYSMNFTLPYTYTHKVLP